MTLDLERFWEENALALARPFSTAKPRAAISLSMDDHWLIEEMRLSSTVRYFRDVAYREVVNRECNARMRERLGIALFPERVFPAPPKRIEEVFGSRQELTEGGTPWLEPSVESIGDLKRLLRRVERTDLRSLVFDEAFERASAEWRSTGGAALQLGRSIRGPVTVGTSVCGTMSYLSFVLDYPDVMDDFTRLLAAKAVEYLSLLRARTGAPARGLQVLDDNCCLLSPRLYERFGLPVLSALFERFSPAPGAVGGDERYQHSDSDMAHLLPFFRELRMTGLNLGPNVPARQIREMVPSAVVWGQVAPATVASGDREAIRREVARDFAAVGADGGLVIATAGSVRAGTSLDSILAYMEAVDDLCRYDR